MPEPLVLDMRDGLTQDVLDGLRRAERVLIAAKSVGTAVLGYWIGDQLSVALIQCTASRVVRAPNLTVRFELAPLLVPTLRLPLSGVLLDVKSARDDVLWSRIIGVLRAGDVLSVAAETNSGSQPMLHVRADGVRVAALRLPRQQAHGQSAA